MAVRLSEKQFNELRSLIHQLQALTDEKSEAGQLVNSINEILESSEIADLNGANLSNADLIRNILFLAVNPTTTMSLRLDEEVREIDLVLQRAKKRKEFDLKQYWAVRVRDIFHALVDAKPQIVHFFDHGAGDEGLVLENEAGQTQFVNAEALAGLFELFANHIECVVLNACYSEVQADAISKHIPYVICINKAVDDRAAIEFAVGFYDALVAGTSIEFAYKLGCQAIQLAGIPEHLTPKLKKNPYIRTG